MRPSFWWWDRKSVFQTLKGAVTVREHIFPSLLELFLFTASLDLEEKGKTPPPQNRTTKKCKSIDKPDKLPDSQSTTEEGGGQCRTVVHVGSTTTCVGRGQRAYTWVRKWWLPWSGCLLRSGMNHKSFQRVPQTSASAHCQERLELKLHGRKGPFKGKV